MTNYELQQNNRNPERKKIRKPLSIQKHPGILRDIPFIVNISKKAIVTSECVSECVCICVCVKLCTSFIVFKRDTFFLCYLLPLLLIL